MLDQPRGVRRFSRRTELTLGVLAAVAVVSVVSTRNTAWWPWSSEAAETDNLFLDDVPKVILEKLQKEGGELEELADGTFKYTASDGKVSSVQKEAGAGGDVQADCRKPKGSLIDPCADLATNLQSVYKESISLMLLLAFLVLVYAGYRYITSLGNAEQTKDAKDWAVAAVTGIALLLLIPLLMKALGVGNSG